MDKFILINMGEAFINQEIPTYPDNNHYKKCHNKSAKI